MKTINGPVASGVAGLVYKRLSEQHYFVANGSGDRKTNLPEIITTYVRE